MASIGLLAAGVAHDLYPDLMAGLSERGLSEPRPRAQHHRVSIPRGLLFFVETLFILTNH